MIRIEVAVLDKDRNLLNGSFTHTIQDGADQLMKKKLPEDQYAALKGDGKAWVSVPIIETQGGPGFSSIKIGVEMCITVNQDAESMRTAADMLMKEGLILVDAQVQPIYSILLQHRKDLDEMQRLQEEIEAEEEDPFS